MPPQDLRPPMTVFLDAFGVEAIVVRPAPDDAPIETVGIWVPPETVDLPTGPEFQRRDQIRIMAFDVTAVPTLPVGTLITAAERQGDPVQVWIVDGLGADRGIDADQVRGIVRFHSEVS